jgi:hypothetical protein
MDTITERIAAEPKPGRQDQVVHPEREQKTFDRHPTNSEGKIQVSGYAERGGLFRPP